MDEWERIVSVGRESVQRYRDAGWSDSDTLFWVPWATWIRVAIAARAR